jgi:hypothetical protein
MNKIMEWLRTHSKLLIGIVIVAILLVWAFWYGGNAPGSKGFSLRGTEETTQAEGENISSENLVTDNSDSQKDDEDTTDLTDKRVDDGKQEAVSDKDEKLADTEEAGASVQLTDTQAVDNEEPDANDGSDSENEKNTYTAEADNSDASNSEGNTENITANASAENEVAGTVVSGNNTEKEDTKKVSGNSSANDNTVNSSGDNTGKGSSNTTDSSTGNSSGSANGSTGNGSAKDNTVNSSGNNTGKGSGNTTNSSTGSSSGNSNGNSTVNGSENSTENGSSNSGDSEKDVSGDDNSTEASSDDEGEGKYTCYISINCATVLGNMDMLTSGKEKYVPQNGVVLAEVSVSFEEGDTVFDVLKKVCKNKGIQLEYSYTPVYGSYYIEGINNLYEFDCGNLSGWMYSVNGTFPNYGCSQYQLSDGDVIKWLYTCDLGTDVGHGMN